ncbi:glutamine--fructose-6-phosphate transaminase (isomerizing) [Stygiolobus caldivivus]|uniref:glutamine--fructose-6-phosphate transaminase (isomerizing) n=1 Tax=Stygiolobus caldivivus TaxID=2824673 RepID=A0A8D5U5K1_9CREN|nr:glutamine--fructose-6-phosphate transaminase (isomerizing) [Stygiolobus caldivivus]BCU69955.1 glutamine--fructose-6-phosphate aminotransferase [Stygiolobus caldivivus]
MGGIFGFVCREPRDLSTVNVGLSRLIYRGYDGAGMTWLNDSLEVTKALGDVSKTPLKVNGKSKVALGHTRYASRGWPTLENTHPLLDCNKKIAVVMDGIIDDYEEIRERLVKQGHKFTSTTDAEVIPHLLEGSRDYLKSAIDIISRVRGIYSFAFIVEGMDKAFVASAGQPIMIGLGDCKYISSDLPSLTGFAENAVILPENSVAEVTPEGVKVYDININVLSPQIKRVKYKEEIVDKGGFPHYMLKEVYDIPSCLVNSYTSLMEKYLSLAAMIVYGAKNIYVIGNGTSLHAGLISYYYFSEVGINANVVSAAEFPYYALQNISTGSVIIAISQSGETSDVIRSIKMAKQRGAVIVGVTNSVGSRLALESNIYLPITAGPELAVPATKTFTSTLVVLRTLSLYTGLNSGKKDRKDLEAFEKDLEELSKQIYTSLPQIEKQAEDAISKVEKDSLYITSSGINFPVALEGALKFKEAALAHAEGIQLGELLHGPIALTNKGYPIIIIKPSEEQAFDLYNKVVKSLSDRGSPIISVSPEGSVKSVETSRDLSPIANVVPLQLMAYKLGVKRGLPIDTPQGLVKAVVS